MKEIGIFLGVVVIDQASKWMVTYFGHAILNHGGVWGVLPGTGWTVGIAGLWALLAFYYGYRRRQGCHSAGLLLILAAGFSNLADRITLGAVRDFIYYPVLQVYGNIADIILAAGVGWIAVTGKLCN